MVEIELVTKALKDAYAFVKKQEQTTETGEILISLFKAEILVKNCFIPPVSDSPQKSKCSECGDIIGEYGYNGQCADCR